MKPHISFSELKDWNTCSFYHKLVHIEGLKGFRGNEYTAFGTAIHTVCENTLLEKQADEAKFLQEFEQQIKILRDDSITLREDLVETLRTQAAKIIPHVPDALKSYFPDGYEVVSTEEQLMVPIEGTPKKYGASFVYLKLRLYCCLLSWWRLLVLSSYESGAVFGFL